MSEPRLTVNNNNIVDDDDVPCLSAETFKALQEFYAEKEVVEKSMDENWVISLTTRK